MTDRHDAAPPAAGAGAASSVAGGTAKSSASPARLSVSYNPRSWLNLAGVVVVAAWLFYLRDTSLPLPVTIVAIVGLVTWAGWTLLPFGRLRDAAIVVSALMGAVAVVGTDAILIAIVIVALVAFASTPGRAAWSSGVLTVLCGILIGLFATIAHSPVEFLLGTYGGLALGIAVGIARRQSHLVEDRERQLLARSLEAERERDHARLLADRAVVARDIHDVLAHSLGGLVIQLDAVEALLEAGRSDDAATRVTAARRLAGDGLAEARRAVAALRDPGVAGPAPVPDAALADLVATHRSLGGAAEVEGVLALDGLAPPQREVAVRVLQEGLSNARRHAPGAVARLAVEHDAERWSLRLATAVPASPETGPGGGHGLVGMRERVAALGDASNLTAEREGADFVVALTLIPAPTPTRAEGAATGNGARP